MRGRQVHLQDDVRACGIEDEQSGKVRQDEDLGPQARYASPHHSSCQHHTLAVEEQTGVRQLLVPLPANDGGAVRSETGIAVHCRPWASLRSDATTCVAGRQEAGLQRLQRGIDWR
eukprot:SRR837773.9822.p2 GENE.SRR837773.9822~~SRR837773.9822.p2  ORF type:complete len:116 (+),score=9.22 SRR837773.9822:313-660(+)